MDSFAFSYLFYALFDWRFLVLLLFNLVANGWPGFELGFHPRL
jgi:hypothetical protein